MIGRAFVVAFVVGLAGCGANPAAPDKPAAPVTATDSDGRLWYVCATGLREYLAVAPDGTVTRTWETDHYLSATPCPAVPIA